MFLIGRMSVNIHFHPFIAVLYPKQIISIYTQSYPFHIRCSGASSTGKSYILQCIDFACGSGTKLKVVTESAGYETVELELEDFSTKRHRLKRSLKGGNLRHFVLEGENWVKPEEPILGAKHSATDQITVSGLLLGLSGLWGNKVRRNSAGNVDSLSFRDVAHLLFVDEKRIIEDLSPIFSGKNALPTKEASIFNLFLTGVDDSSVIAYETKKDSHARKKAQLEILDRMIGRTEEQLAKAEKEPESVAERKKHVEDAIAARAEGVTTNQNEIASQEQLRQTAWGLVQRVSAKRNATQQLKTRFKLLEDHYNNDLQRLKAIIEADHYSHSCEKYVARSAGPGPRITTLTTILLTKRARCRIFARRARKKCVRFNRS